jgi:hypothetical protein
MVWWVDIWVQDGRRSKRLQKITRETSYLAMLTKNIRVGKWNMLLG